MLTFPLNFVFKCLSKNIGLYKDTQFDIDV